MMLLRSVSSKRQDAPLEAHSGIVMVQGEHPVAHCCLDCTSGQGLAWGAEEAAALMWGGSGGRKGGER